jgi:hypothetical protein
MNTDDDAIRAGMQVAYVLSMIGELAKANGIGKSKVKSFAKDCPYLKPAVNSKDDPTAEQMIIVGYNGEAREPQVILNSIHYHTDIMPDKFRKWVYRVIEDLRVYNEKN